ncbi:MAG: DUF4419 domain-containing protein [Myxococcota bacterium]
MEAVVSPLAKKRAVELEPLLGVSKVHAKSASLAEVAIPVQSGAHTMANGLVETVHTAFAQHRPLTLSPDDVWLAILQGFAIHVRENAEQLRERFVDFKGIRTLTVRTHDPADWDTNIRRFREALAEGVNPGLLAAQTAPFTTSTDDVVTAFSIAAMDCFSPYFDFELACICGIPRITLLGTVDDWLDVRDRFRVLAEYDLRWWARVLEPVLAQFIAAAAGTVDREFWQAIYKPKASYGRDHITGWLTRLFPYLEQDRRFSRNAFIHREWIHAPVDPSRLPRGLSSAEVRLEEQLFVLRSGFFGARQCADGSLAPVIGWTASESDVSRVFEQLANRFQFDPPSDGEWGGSFVPATLIEFSSRFGGGRLFDGELTMLAPPARGTDAGGVPLLAKEEEQITFVTQRAVHFATLRDGRRLLVAREHLRYELPRTLVFIAEADAVKPPFSVLAHSMLEFFQRLARSDTFPWQPRGNWTPQK